MKVKFDANGYVSEWAMCPDNSGHVCLEGGATVDDVPDEDLPTFYIEYNAYRMDGGKLVKDEGRLSEIRLEREKQGLRDRRAVECFPVVNRGKAWYDTLFDEEKNELTTWYLDWLDVTETLIAPNEPDWLAREVR